MISSYALKRLLAVTYALVLISSFAACQSNPQLPSHPAYSIHTVQDTVDLHRVGSLVTFQVTAVFKNAGATDLYFDGCLTAAERKVNSAWYVVFRPACMYGNPGRLKPSDSVIIDIVKRRNLIYNEPNPELVGAGEYRLVFAGGYYDNNSMIVYSPPNSVVSSSFFVRDSSPPK